jgi:sulfite reductase (NADPH) flavoprotein alpha-component
MTDASPAAAPAPSAYNRKNPFLAEITHRESLTRPGSGKDTKHLVLSLRGSGLTYRRAIRGILPQRRRVEEILARWGSTPGLR